MVKKESSNFSSHVKWIESRSAPDNPPGFPPQPQVISPSPAVTRSRVVEKSLKYHDPASNGSRNPPEDQKHGRTTCRKRLRPDFYAPPARKEPASTPRRRGRPLKAPLMTPEICAPPPIKESSATPRRRGRPPKARVTPQISSQELERKNDNRPSSHQEKETGNRDQAPSTPLVNNQVLEQSPLTNISHIPHNSTFIDTPLVESPGYESARNVDQNDQIGQEIDPKVLHHVSQYIDGSLTTIDVTKLNSWKKDLVHLREAIFRKHGDITQGCSLESDCMKNLVLFGICKVVQDLQWKKLEDLDMSTLDSYYTTVRDAENMKFNVKWLRNRLDEIKEAFKLADEAKSMVEERKRLLESVEDKKIEIVMRKVELQRLELEIQDLEEAFARDNVMAEQLNRNIGAQTSKLAGFMCSNLMDGHI